MKKWLLSAVFALYLAFAVCPVEASAIGSEVCTGSCGPNLTYTFYSDGTLIISGTGLMNEYNRREIMSTAMSQYISTAPWGILSESRYTLDRSYNGILKGYSHLQDKNWDALNTIIIEEGVTSIGSFAFCHAWELEKVELPSTLERIGEMAFYRSPAKELVIPSNVVQVESNALALQNGSRRNLLAIGVEAANKYKWSTRANEVFYYGTEEQWKNYKNTSSSSITGTTLYYDAVYNPDAVYRYDEATKTLTYSGSGWIQSFDLFQDPMKSKKAQIEHIVIKEGITGIGAHAFLNCTALKSVDIADSVTSIGNYAFKGCTALKSVDIPDSVTSIGNSAFWGCTALETVTISDSVTSIGYSAFSGCSNLKQCKLPAKLESIGDNAFNGCTAWEVNGLPESLKSIGQGAFQNCHSFTEVTIPSAVESLGAYLFTGCQNLTKITVNCNVPANAFNGLDCLKEVTIGPAAESIGDSAFKKCTGLTEVTIGPAVESIGDGAYKDCTGLTELEIPANVTNLSDTAFSGCTGLTKLTVNTSLTSTTFRGNTALQEVVLGEGAAKLGADTFSGCSALTSVNISKSVTEIGSAAFKNCDALTALPGLGSATVIAENTFEDCDGLTKITLPEGITEIGVKAFYGCDNLEEITLPNSLLTVGEEAFSTCLKLTTIRFGSGLQTIGKKAFAYCDTLPELSLPEGLKTLGQSAFYDCDGLQTLTIPGTLETIEEQVFEGCDALKEVTIQDGVKELGRSMFAGCKALTKINLRNSLTTIGATAFSGCSAMTELEIPGSVTTIGSGAFKACDALQTVKIGYGMEVLSANAFSGCTALEQVILPNSIRRIEGYVFKDCKALKTVKTEGDVPTGASDYETDILQAYAFSGCSALETVELPAGITAIADNAMKQCYSLLSLTMGEKVITIGKEAFYKCENLLSVKGSKGVTSIGSGAFYECTQLTRVDTGDALLAIDNRAFYQCSGLTKFNFGNVQFIGTEAFYKCESLQEVVLPDTLQQIPDKAFWGCIHLKTLDTGDGVTTIGNEAFEGCKRLAKAELGDSVVTVGPEAFRDCVEMTNLTIGKSLQNIGKNAFWNCEALNKVNTTDLANWCTIHFETPNDNPAAYAESLYVNDELLTDLVVPASVIEIGRNAFNNCKSLKSVAFSENTTQLNNGCFANCHNLKTLYIPKSVEIIREASFMDCNALDTVNYAGTHEDWEDDVSIAPMNDPLYEAKFNYNATNTHEHEYKETVTPPTCVDEGYTTYKCDCGDEKIEDRKPAEGHKWNEGEVTKEPTEEAEGEKIVTCDVCGETETRVIPKKEHTHNYYKDTVTPPTCVDEGYTTYKCDCGDEKTEDRKQAEGHKWNDGEITKEPTEETEGEKTVTCDVCGETETRVIPKLEIPTEGTQKTPGEAWEYDNDGTGKNDDLTSAEAVTLDQTYRGRVGKAGDLADCYQIPANGAELKFTATLWSTTMHILEDRGLEIQFYDAEGQLVTPDKSNVLTRDLEGVLLYDFLHTYQFAAGSPVAYAKFSVKNAEKGNGYSFKAEVTGEAPHVHSYREEVTPSTCDKEGCITYTCDCGDKKTEVIPMKDHEWDDGEVTKEATEEAEGEKTFTCTVCGGTKTEVIPKLEHVHSFGEAWQSDEAGHWQQCACGVKDGEGAHADADRNGSCEICGYKMEVISGDSIASGTCGENLTWNLAKSGVLTISGTGSMLPYIAPWSEHADQITKVILEDGISNVGAEAFKNCRNLAEATLPDSVTIIAHGAFSGCGKLETVNLPDHLTKLVGEAFAGCSALKEVTIPASVTDIGYSAFRNCTALQQITFQGSAPKIGNGAFQGVTAQVAFPEEDTTWNDATKQSYGGTLTWGDEHEHSYTETVTPPTCEELGFTTYTCSCGHSYEGDYTDPLPHEYEYEDAENTRGTCIHCGAATFVDFTSFDELKELAKLDDSEINLYYKGTGPLTIEEDLILDNWISLYAEDLVIPEGATLTVEDGFTSIHADNLTVNGALVNDGMIFVFDSLTVNGKVQQNLLLIMADPIHSTATGTENIQPGTLFEDAGLGILAERPLMWYCIYTNQTELEALAAQANASTDSRSMYLFEYGGEEGSVFHLSRSVELGEASVFDMKPSFVIDPGVTLTSQGAIYVDEGTATIKGILNNEGYLEINHSSGAALNFSDGGTYTGSGELRVYTNEETYPEAVITGIDMSGFRIEEKTETSGEETTRYFKLTYEASEDPVPPVAAAITRISGTNRIKTAIASADKLKEVLGVEKFNTIVVANAMDFPDALSGSYLAAVAKAPILLYADGQALVTDYIKNNLAPSGIVYILGGEKSVSNEIINKLSGIPCARVAGSGRFATSLAIIRKADEIRGSKPDKVLICHALAFADSLSASATGLPILLVNGAGSLNADQKAYLDSVRGAELYVIGGKNSVSEDILTALNAYDANGAERVFGSGRELTSVEVAKKFFPEAKAAALASSLSFPDGLSGGPVAYAMNMPLLLTRETKESVAESYVNTNGIIEGYVIGGTDAVADVTARAVFGESTVIK